MDSEEPSSNQLQISEILEDDDNLDALLGLEGADGRSNLLVDNEEDMQQFLEGLSVTENAAPASSSLDTFLDDQLSPTSFINRVTGAPIPSSSPSISPTNLRRGNEAESSAEALLVTPNMSMSPTTLLDSLLSATNIGSDDPVRSILSTAAVDPTAIGSQEEDDTNDAATFPPAPPLSSESVELSSLQELMQDTSANKSNPDASNAIHSSDDNFADVSRMENSLDASYFGSVKDDGPSMFDLTSGAALDNIDDTVFVIGSDEEEEEDGLNSFMTAMEDASSILSKISTTGTLETMGSMAAESAQEPKDETTSTEMAPDPEVETTDTVLEPELWSDITSSAGLTSHRAIQATVSFAQSVEQHAASEDPFPVPDIPAPLSLEEDPTTPKRSGREPLIVSIDDRAALLERGGLLDTAVSTTNKAPSPSNVVVTTSSPPESTLMGETILLQEEPSIQNLDKERKVDPPYDGGNILSSIAPLPLSSDPDAFKGTVTSEEQVDLSVPSLSDDVPASPITLMHFQSDNVDTEKVSNEGKVIFVAEVNPVAIFNNAILVDCPSATAGTVDPSQGKATSVVRTESSEVDVLDEPIVPRVLESEIINAVRNENDSTATAEFVGTTNATLINQPSILDVGSVKAITDIRLNHEVKSLLQVEFPSVLESGNKKSDVSLSSASSTISHGSYSKARASSSNIAASTKAEDMQKRRSVYGGSLPPRSPASRHDQNDPMNTRAFAASVSKKLSDAEAVRRDDVDTERGVESKWIKQSLAINFNPKKSIFAGKLDKKKKSTDSISSLGSPPEPCFDSDSDEYSSSQDGSVNSSTMSNEIGNKEAEMWDMMPNNGLFLSIESADNRSQYVVSADSRSPSLVQAVGRTDDSVTASSIAPSEAEVNKLNKLSTKPSFKSDASLSSTAVKSRNFNVALSFSQHSRGSLCSGRSRDGKLGSRGSKSFISPVGKSGQRSKPSIRLELDTASLGRITLKPPKSPNRTAFPTTHCSSPDLYKLNEEPSQSQQPTPIKFSIPDSGFDLSATDQLLIADALPSDILSPESLVEKYASFVKEEEAIREQDAAILQDDWLSLSSLSPFDLPFRYTNSFAPLMLIGSLMWRQMVSCWKHAEISRTMIACAMFPQMDDDVNVSEARGSKHSVASSHRIRRSFIELELNGVQYRTKVTKPDTKIFKGFDLDRRNYSLSTFLTQIKYEPPLPRSEVLRHESSNNSPNNVTIGNLVEMANSSLPELSLLVKDIIAFSSMNSSWDQDAEVMQFSVDIKAVDAIVRKAKRKYHDDFLQVKDILRAKIVFPNEGALVCGLIRLLQLTKNSDSNSSTDYHGISLVRIKNLFAAETSTCFDTLHQSPLPTGYRHVLLNVRLKSGLLAELQFNLLHLFSALGQDGYTLHRELIDLHSALSEREKRSKLVSRFDMNEVVNDAINCNLSHSKSESFLHDIGSTPAVPIASSESSSAECSNEINDLSQEARDKHLGSITTDMNSNLSRGDIFLAILANGSIAASRSPRDVSVFYCLYILFVLVLNQESEATISKLGFGVTTVNDVFEYSRKCLLRCLMISNEAMSIGMTGWLEYGASSTIDRFSELPFSFLNHLIYIYGRQEKWVDAECVCRALFIRCEHYLPAHHPTTLTSLVDLAIISSITGNHKFAEKTISRAAGRLSKFLTEMERMYVNHVTKIRPATKADKNVVGIEHDRGAHTILTSFASKLKKQLHRDIVYLVGPDNYIILTNHCFVADSFAVLANCVSSANFFLGAGSDPSENYGLQFWQMAYKHYEYAFRAFVKTRSLDDPAVGRAAYGIARCLREFGKTEKALQLLALIVPFKDDAVFEPTSSSKKYATGSPTPSEQNINDGSKAPSTPVPRFLPVTASAKIATENLKTPKLLSKALCLWLMAVLSIDRSRNEEGREQAFGYLHAASVALQASLNEESHVENDTTKAVCIRFLAMIEDEAEQISEPIYE